MEESDLADYLRHVTDLTFLLTSRTSLLDTTTYLLLSLRLFTAWIHPSNTEPIEHHQ